MILGRLGITKDDVYEAAQKIAESGVVPTMHMVRAHLGSGSLGTIHKHLLAWKQERLLKPAIKVSSGKDSIKVKELYSEIQSLGVTIKLQIKQNTTLAAQVFDLEQENAELKDYRQNSQAELNKLRNLNSQLQQQTTQHESLLSEISRSHADHLNLLLQEKNTEIEGLKNELRAVHQASMDMVRKTSFEGQDLVMAERIKNINMNDQMQRLAKKIDQLDRVANTYKPKKDNCQPREIKTYTLEEIQKT